MNIAIIAQFYKTVEPAIKRVKVLRELWKGKIAWYILETKNGYFILSERQARACGYKTELKDRRYKLKKFRDL